MGSRKYSEGEDTILYLQKGFLCGSLGEVLDWNGVRKEG